MICRITSDAPPCSSTAGRCSSARRDPEPLGGQTIIAAAVDGFELDAAPGCGGGIVRQKSLGRGVVVIAPKAVTAFARAGLEAGREQSARPQRSMNAAQIGAQFGG